MDYNAMLNTGIRIFLLMAAGAAIYKLMTDYLAKKEQKRKEPLTVEVIRDVPQDKGNM